MKKIAFVLLASWSVVAGATETVSGGAGAPGSSAGSGDFTKEVTCGTALLSSSLVATRNFHGVQGRGFLISARRDGQAGIYSFSAKGASFAVLSDSLKPSSENYRTRSYEFQTRLPGEKEKTDFVYRQLVSGGAEAGLELKPGATTGVELASEEANDLFAQKILVQRFSESLASIPHGIPAQQTMMFPNLVKLQREEVRGALSKIVCGCKDVEELKEPLAKMRASREVKVFDVKFPCE